MEREGGKRRVGDQNLGSIYHERNKIKDEKMCIQDFHLHK